MKVQVWRHHLEDNGGLLVAAYEARGATVTSQLVGPFGAPSDEACDVLIVLGSSESVYDESVQEEWLNREMTRMAELIDAGTRVFGVCFGGQMLTVHFGGIVTPSGSEELGFSDIEVIDPRFPSGPWCEDHGDACQVDPSARVVARNDFSLQAAVWGSHLGVQFHPEVDAEQLREWQGVEVPQSPRALTMSNMIAQAEQQPDDLRRRAALLVDYFESL